MAGIFPKPSWNFWLACLCLPQTEPQFQTSHGVSLPWFIATKTAIVLTVPQAWIFPNFASKSSQSLLAARLQVGPYNLPCPDRTTAPCSWAGSQSSSRTKCHVFPPFLPRFSRFSWVNASQFFTCLWSVPSILKLLIFMMFPIFSLFWEVTSQCSLETFQNFPPLPSSWRPM